MRRAVRTVARPYGLASRPTKRREDVVPDHAMRSVYPVTNDKTSCSRRVSPLPNCTLSSTRRHNCNAVDGSRCGTTMNLVSHPSSRSCKTCANCFNRSSSHRCHHSTTTQHNHHQLWNNNDSWTVSWPVPRPRNGGCDSNTWIRQRRTNRRHPTATARSPRATGNKRNCNIRLRSSSFYPRRCPVIAAKRMMTVKNPSNSR